MKKILLITIFLLSLLPAICSAGNYVVKSDSKSFNPLSGTYDLQGNIYVQIPVQNTNITITGDRAQVRIYNMEVEAENNIALTYDDLTFNCDSVLVKVSDNTAYVNGNMKFIHGNTTILADSGSYCWKTRLAEFSGNVNVNGKKMKKNITYNVNTKKIV